MTGEDQAAKAEGEVGEEDVEALKQARDAESSGLNVLEELIDRLS